MFCYWSRLSSIPRCPAKRVADWMLVSSLPPLMTAQGQWEIILGIETYWVRHVTRKTIHPNHIAGSLKTNSMHEARWSGLRHFVRKRLFFSPMFLWPPTLCHWNKVKKKEKETFLQRSPQLSAHPDCCRLSIPHRVYGSFVVTLRPGCSNHNEGCSRWPYHEPLVERDDLRGSRAKASVCKPLVAGCRYSRSHTLWWIQIRSPMLAWLYNKVGDCGILPVYLC